MPIGCCDCARRPLVLFDGAGGEVPATLVSLGKKASARLDTRQPIERESVLRFTLVQALASGDKMDLIIQKAVELGAVGVIPLAAERSILKLNAERAGKRLAHWRQVLVSACEQCGRNRLPVISGCYHWTTISTREQGMWHDSCSRREIPKAIANGSAICPDRAVRCTFWSDPKAGGANVKWQPCFGPGVDR